MLLCPAVLALVHELPGGFDSRAPAEISRARGRRFLRDFPREALHVIGRNLGRLYLRALEEEEEEEERWRRAEERRRRRRRGRSTSQSRSRSRERDGDRRRDYGRDRRNR